MTRKRAPDPKPKSRSKADEIATGVSTGRVADQRERPRELDQLEVFIGRWITEGETVAAPDAPATAIVASDVYQWAPGKYFVVHPAYGRIGTIAVGGVEIIGFDPETRQFQTYFFDSQGNVTRQRLSVRDGVWTWADSHSRCTGVLSDDGTTLTARHERSDDGATWVQSMNVVLRKIE